MQSKLYISLTYHIGRADILKLGFSGSYSTFIIKVSIFIFESVFLRLRYGRMRLLCKYYKFVTERKYIHMYNVKAVCFQISY